MFLAELLSQLNSLLVKFPSFNFAKATSKRRLLPIPPPEREWVTWEDDTPKRAISEEGETLLFYLPNLNPQTTVVSPSFFLTLPH